MAKTKYKTTKKFKNKYVIDVSGIKRGLDGETFNQDEQVDMILRGTIDNLNNQFTGLKATLKRI